MSPSGGTRSCRWMIVSRLFSRPSAPDEIIVASLPSTSGHPSIAGRRGDKASKSRFKTYPIGFCHIDIAEVPTQQGKLPAGFSAGACRRCDRRQYSLVAEDRRE